MDERENFHSNRWTLQHSWDQSAIVSSSLKLIPENRADFIQLQTMPICHLSLTCKDQMKIQRIAPGGFHFSGVLVLQISERLARD